MILFHKMTAVGATGVGVTAVGVTAVGVTAVRNKLEFSTIITIRSNIIL